MVFFVLLIAAAGHAAGVAQVANQSICKESTQVVTGWAIPPPSIRGNQMLLMCQQDYNRAVGFCVFADEERKNCTVLVDRPGSNQWEAMAVDCESGKPIGEQKL